jgi:hypothetical protein
VRPTRPITSVLDQLCVAEEASPGSGRSEDTEAGFVCLWGSEAQRVGWDALGDNNQVGGMTVSACVQILLQMPAELRFLVVPCFSVLQPRGCASGHIAVVFGHI